MRADMRWIPACAGMTSRWFSRLRGNDVPAAAPVVILAKAGIQNLP